MKKVFYFLLVVSCTFAFSCKKDNNPTPVPPIISFENFTTSDNLTGRLTINFTDNDGDIGYEEAQQTASNYDFYMRYYYKNYLGNYVPFYYHSSGDPLSDSTIYVYHIPYVANNIKTKVLDGQIIIDLNGYKPGNLDSLNNFRYTIWIFDRAGHKSNVITTPGFHTSY